MKRKRKNRKPPPTQNAPASIEQTAEHEAADVVATHEAPLLWSGWKRGIASVVIAGYLFVLLLGPLSNPVASRHLTAPIAQHVAPLHRALFMGHGYRFFAPNPGDSHLVQYKITRQDGTQIKGMFPDRKTMSPRLLYHRWFMLSETVFSEHAQTPSPGEFRKLNEDKQRRVKLLTAGGKLRLAQQLETERSRAENRYNQTIKRIQSLVKSMGKFLLKKHDGDEIELSVATRTIPFPAEIRQGADLNDEVFLRYPTNAVIGRFIASDFSNQEESE